MDDRHLSLRQLAVKSGYSAATLRRYLPPALLSRNTPRGKITVSWRAFCDWQRDRMRAIQGDSLVMDILRDMARVQ